MATLDDLFLEYLHRIEPNSKAVGRAIAAHQPLRDDLKADTIFGPYLETSMLSGSYGRDTAILHIKDVDIILKTTFTRSELAERARTGETEQSCLLRLTQEAIKRTGRDARTRAARRSIHVKLPEEINSDATVPELTLDIVPVLIESDAHTDPMTIADRETVAWYDTFPNSQLADSIVRNNQSTIITDRHSYKPLVKLFKAWKAVHFPTQKTPKGFVLECLTAQYHDPDAAHWIDAIHNLWSNILADWPAPDLMWSIPTVHDVSNATPNQIAIAKTVEEAKEVASTLKSHLALVEQAMEEAETDLAQSARTLQRVLGQDCELFCFPDPDDSGGATTKNMTPLRKTGSDHDIREAPAFG